MTLIYGYIFYYFSALVGISVGYHRYFSHRSFKTHYLFEIIMLFFGLICGGRSAITWSAVHRMHHSSSDTEKDPHSPKYLGAKNIIFSRWKVNYIPRKYIADLIKNPRVVFFHKYGKYIHVFYALTILTIGIDYFIIFVLMPYVLSWISFGLLNYVSHKNGEPVDVPFMNILAPGEGWHKYHHHNPMKTKLNNYDPAGILIEKFFAISKSSS